jgi:hypothetical protein
VTFERFGRRVYGRDVVHAPYVCAGNWVFGTGLRATTDDGTIDPELARPGRPFGASPRAQREAAAIFAGMASGLQEAGSSIGRIARLDQYYPDARHVYNYNVAR